MKYPIEQLLKNEKIVCHEVRASTYQTNHVLLHFFITQSKDNKGDLPVFKMGYERYRATVDDITNDNSKPEQDLIRHYSLINIEDHHNVLFNHPATNNELFQQKNDWTGEQPEIVIHPNSTETSSLSSTSANNIAMNKNLRYVSEMADNSIYNTDDILTEKTYLATQDSALKDHLAPKSSESIEEIKENEQKSSHSIWTSNIHFDKFEQCTNEELLNLLKKYKPYIGLAIKPNLDTESRTNIDMESIFGTSFDIVRIKTNLFNKDDDDNHYDTNNLLVS